jgi:hypothetical protein
MGESEKQATLKVVLIMQQFHVTCCEDQGMPTMASPGHLEMFD